MFMRFFSHEIRTPLNSVCVGATIMVNELKRPLGEHRERSLLATALDTQKSCQSAVDVLNGMILYDKIVNGLVSLEKRTFDPWKLVCDVVKPFRAQVKLICVCVCMCDK